MAIRQTKLVIKNNSTPSAIFSGATLLQGEPIVNTADGILMFSGVTTSPFTSTFTPAGPGGNSTFFEVGSNLYQLKIRDKITSYSGETDLSGKFLSGTTSGFVLADTSSIQGIDRYVTGATLTSSADTSSNQQTSTLNYNLTTPGGFTFVTQNTFTTGGTYDNTSRLITFKRNDGLTGFTVDLSTIDVNDTFVTGGTITYTGRTGTVTLTRNDGTSIPIDNLYDTYITGFTYNNNTFTLTDNSGNTFSQTINTVTGLTVNGDLTVTGNTSLQSFTGTTGTINGNLTVTGNTSLQGLTAATTNINGDLTVTGNTSLQGLTATTTNVNGNLTVTGNTSLQSFTGTTGIINGDLTVTGSTTTNSISAATYNTNLGNNLVVYTNGSGQLSAESGFGYDAGNNKLTVGYVDVNNDVVIKGDLTVLGQAISAFTSNLYIEDPSITLNYNPTGSSASFSVNSGFVVQDGNGISGGSVNFDIVRMQSLSGDTNEYPLETGYTNRGWITQLNDIIIRSTDVNDSGSAVAGNITGVRVLAEFDTLSGGSY